VQQGSGGAVLRNGLRRQRNGGACETSNHRYAIAIKPLRDQRSAHTGFHLVIGYEQFDLLAKHRAAEVVDGHLNSNGGALACNVAVG
jgi:hypothetical protein